MIAQLYVDAATIAAWNAQVASPPKGWDENAPSAALKVLLDEDLHQVVSGVPLDATGVTLLRTTSGRRCAVIVHDDASAATFSADPWYWEALCYPKREDRVPDWPGVFNAISGDLP
jgi:hypothetical protein